MQDSMPSLTELRPAHRRALVQAHKHKGMIRRCEVHMSNDNGFAITEVIDTLYNMKLLYAGEYYNVYRLTDMGKVVAHKLASKAGA